MRRRRARTCRRSPAKGLVLAELLLALLVLGAVVLFAAQRGGQHIMRQEEQALALAVAELQRALRRYYWHDMRDACSSDPPVNTVHIRDTADFPAWLRAAVRAVSRHADPPQAGTVLIQLDSLRTTPLSSIRLQLPARYRGMVLQKVSRRIGSQHQIVAGRPHLIWRRAVEAPPTMPQHNPLLDRDLHCEDATPP